MNYLKSCALICSILRPIKWKWRKKEMEQLVSELGWKLIENRKNRQIVRIADMFVADIYSAGRDIVGIELILEAFPEIGWLDPSMSSDEYRSRYYEFIQNWSQAVGLAIPLMGSPTSRSRVAGEMIAENHGAIMIACWDVIDGILSIQMKQEDRELPFRILIAVSPPQL